MDKSIQSRKNLYLSLPKVDVQKYAFPFFVTFAIFVASHLPAFTGQMWAHDALNFFELDNQFELGRWAVPLYVAIRGNFAVPWLVGLLQGVCISLSVTLLARLFEFGKIGTICAAAVLVCNVSVTTLVATYMPYADVQTFAFLCAVLSIVAFFKVPRPFGQVFSVVFLVIAIGLYQAYISAALGLFVLMIFWRAQQEQSDLKSISRDIIHFLIVLVATVALYAFILMLVFNYNEIFSSTLYNSPYKLTEMTPLMFFGAIPTAYVQFFNYFFLENGFNTPVVIAWNIFVAIVLAVSFVFYLVRIKEKKPLVLLSLVLLCLLPLMLNCASLFSMGTLHLLMEYSFNLAYLVPLVCLATAKFNLLLQEPIAVLTKAAAAVLCLIIGWHGLVYANGAYTCRQLIFNQSYASLEDMWADFASLEGYVPETTHVELVGDLNKWEGAFKGPEALAYYGTLTGYSLTSITYDTSVQKFYKYVLGKNVNIDLNTVGLVPADVVAKMPAYPQQGYCQWVGDIIVVKLSN